MDILTLPLSAAFFVLQDTPMQLPNLPTPTPSPEIPLSDVERIINVSAARAQELSLQQMAFIVIVMAFIAIILYLWRRPNKPAPEVTAVEAMSKVLSEVQKENEEQRTQHTQLIGENMTAFADASNRMADSVDKLDSNVDRLATHIEQLAGRETARDKTLQSMSSAVETMVKEGSEPLRKLIDLVNGVIQTLDRLECQQGDLIAAVETFTKAAEACEQKQHDTGKLPPIIEHLDAEGADKPKDSAA